jgi:hypothetical protein
MEIYPGEGTIFADILFIILYLQEKSSALRRIFRAFKGYLLHCFHWRPISGMASRDRLDSASGLAR